MCKLSIIVPCYNPKKYLDTLLNSIVDEHIEKSQIEVIIVDDCSTENYDDELKSFSDRLQIKFLKTDFNKRKPAHPRNLGIEAATGEWITFIDQDDYFCKDGLVSVFNSFSDFDKMEEYNIPKCFSSPIVNYNQHGETILSDDLVHGKFYKRDWLNDFDFKFNEKMNIFEDIEFSNKINRIIIPSFNGHLYVLKNPTYTWNDTLDSLGKNQLKKGFVGYITDNYDDFLTAYIKPYLKEPSVDKRYDLYELIVNLYQMYYIFQLWHTYKIDETPFLKDSHLVLIKILQKYKINVDFIIDYCNKKNILKEIAKYIVDGYLKQATPTETFKDFLTRVSTYNIVKNDKNLNIEPYFNGEPSIDLGHRPWLTIVIPCYNSGSSLPNLLDSIVAQNMNDDIEVVLSDDWSTKPYQDVVEKYKDILCIKQIKTDYNFGPGNTREKGVSIATGEWVMFADHDDEFIPNTFMDCKKAIKESGEKYYAIANFYEQDPVTKKKLSEMKKTKNWNHAKFYNLDNLWHAYDIHFKKDLTSHEDIYISSQINCAMMDCQNGQPLYIDKFIYIWNKKDNSISRQEYGGHEFLEVFYKDYIESTGTPYLDNYEKGIIDKGYALVNTVQILGYCYFYMQGFIFHQGYENYFRENETWAREYLVRLKEVMNVTNNDILGLMMYNNCHLYLETKKTANLATGPIIEFMSFKDWLDYLHKDTENLKTVKSFMSKEGAENY